MHRVLAVVGLSGVVGLCGLLGCSPGQQAGSQTNWLSVCESDDDCDGLQCICGACTLPCDSEDECADLSGTSCVPPNDPGAIAFCAGAAPQGGLCIATCDDDSSCAAGSICLAGACSPLEGGRARVDVDLTVRHQTLTGFGAGLAYEEDEMAAHPSRDQLFEAMFSASGFDVIRVRNRYEGDNDDDLLVTREILGEAEALLGRRPLLLMNSGSPIAALKANGSKTCSGDPATCTLSRLADGSFDYAGFADYWRNSLDAYANAGITPDFLSIQNNPNWVPPSSATVDACRFLPEEGTTSVTVDGATVDVEYPGYREALAAVRSAISDLESFPKIAAPDVSGAGSVEDYAQVLDPADFDALSLHLYGQDPAAVDVALLQSVGELGRGYDRPVFQSEMSADGHATAILLHHALTTLGASVYLQNDFVSSASSLDANPAALFALTADGFEAQRPYYVLQHYARWTDPGWVRVDAVNTTTDLLSSAWLSPAEDELTIVLFNQGTTPIDAELVLPPEARQLSSTEVIRTTLDGLERAADLGSLPAERVVKLPAHALVTVHLSDE